MCAEPARQGKTRVVTAGLLHCLEVFFQKFRSGLARLAEVHRLLCALVENDAAGLSTSTASLSSLTRESCCPSFVEGASPPAGPATATGPASRSVSTEKFPVACGCTSHEAWDSSC